MSVIIYNQNNADHPKTKTNFIYSKNTPIYFSIQLKNTLQQFNSTKHLNTFPKLRITKMILSKFLSVGRISSDILKEKQSITLREK